MWAGVVKRLSRFFAFDGVSRGVGASAAAHQPCPPCRSSLFRMFSVTACPPHACDDEVLQLEPTASDRSG